MDTTSHQLTDLINSETLRAFQEALARITGVPAVICDAEGRAVIGPSGAPEMLALLLGDEARPRLEALLVELSTTDGPAPESGPLAFHTAAIELHDERLGTIIVGGVPAREVDAERAAAIAGMLDLDDGARDRVAEHLPPWSEAQCRTAEQVVGALAAILSTLAEQALRLREAADKLDAVHGIVDLTSGATDIQPMLDAIAQQVTELMRVKACSIRLLDDAGRELVIAAVHNLSRVYQNKGAVLVDQNPIDRAALDGEVVYVEDASEDTRSRFREQARREGIVSGLSVGMSFRGQTIGVMRIYANHRHRFSTAEAALLRAIASQATAAILHRRLTLEAVGAERYARQLTYAGDIQRRMIPAHAPTHPRIEFACLYEPTSDVGGDFYDFLTWSDSGEVGLCVADIVGKGLPAALLMAALRTAFRLYAYATLEVTEAMTMTNIHMCRETLVSEFATLFYGIFDDEGRTLTYCNAGHDPPLLARRGELTQLCNNNFIIGVEQNESYTRETVPLEVGDVIVFYTDGLVDAVNFSGEPFGRERLAESVLRNASNDAERVCKQLIWDVRRFVGLADQADDMTLVVAKVNQSFEQA